MHPLPSLLTMPLPLAVLLFSTILCNLSTPTTSVPLPPNFPISSRSGILSWGHDWRGFAATVLATLPWAIVAVFDAIDTHYRPAQQVAVRLFAATFCLFTAYTTGILFVISVTHSIQVDRSGRHDEVAAVTVLLIFNLYHVARNMRGWLQFFSIRRIAPLFHTMQTHIADNFPTFQKGCHTSIVLPSTEDGTTTSSTSLPSPATSGKPRPSSHYQDKSHQPCVQGLLRLRVSQRLVDNDWRIGTPFLNPFFRLHPATIPRHPTPEEEAWADAMWRAWWTQDTVLLDTQPHSLDAPHGFRCDQQHRFPDVADLLSTHPSALPPPDGERERGRLLPVVTDQATGTVITDRYQWARALLTYGGNEGQQDTHGEALMNVMNVCDATCIAILVREKTSFIPNRMSSLWYSTARFEDVYEEKTNEMFMRRRYPHVMFPTWSSWLRIAHDIANHSRQPMSMTEKSLVLLAGELASASVILVRYSAKYRLLVDQIYQDGINARWTFGWSGLLACFSHLWTHERIYVAMLNGLSLLALHSTTEVEEIDPNVRAMMYGYAAFAVSDRAVGKRIIEDRKAELLRRYSENKGKTCRGSGLCAIRLACRELGLPAEASHMDGLPAFCVGWAGEFLEYKPGNQAPEHGLDHDRVEALQGSSNVWRYPYSHN